MHVRRRGHEKLVPRKNMWYFPLIPRLQRLYFSLQTTREMRWHCEHPRENGFFCLLLHMQKLGILLTSINVQPTNSPTSTLIPHVSSERGRGTTTLPPSINVQLTILPHLIEPNTLNFNAPLLALMFHLKQVGVLLLCHHLLLVSLQILSHLIKSHILNFNTPLLALIFPPLLVHIFILRLVRHMCHLPLR